MYRVFLLTASLLPTISLQQTCKEDFDETVCANFSFSAETNLKSSVDKLVIRNARGVILNENFSQLRATTEIEISDSSITSLEPGALCCVPRLSSVVFKNNTRFPAIKDDIFDDCKFLRRLYLIGANLRVENEAFGELKSLQTLSMTGAVLPHPLSSDLFKGLDSLKFLAIRHSRIGSLRNGVFNLLKNLKTLDLQNNEIEAIEDKVFGDLPNLSVLNLSGNSIKYLSWNEFDRLRSLQVLALDHNDFKDVAVEKLLKAAPKLQRVFFSWDKLTAQSRKSIEDTFRRRNITYIYIGAPF